MVTEVKSSKLEEAYEALSQNLEGNPLPFTQDRFFQEAFERRQVVMEDGHGKNYQFGAHYHGYGKGIVKGNNLCFRVKKIEDQEMVELDFKVNHVFRQRLQQAMSQHSCRLLQAEIGGYQDQTVERLDFKGQGSILVGGNPKIIALYTRVIVRVPKESTFTNLKGLLKKVHLEDVLEPSSAEDLERLKVGHLFRQFFPKEASLFERTEEFYHLSISALKAKIIEKSSAMKDHFRVYLPRIQPYETLRGKVRYQVEGLKDTCSELGARVLLSTVVCYENQKQLGIDRVVSILKMGMLPGEWRAAIGMDVDAFYESDIDLKNGGADSVFTELLTEKFYQQGTVLKKFGYANKNSITLVLDLSLLETGTYQYSGGEEGSRKWKELYLNRPTIFDLIKEENEKMKPCNEVMVKDRIPPSAIKGILVPNEELREMLIRTLREKNLIQLNNGIETLCDVPVDRFIRNYQLEKLKKKPS